MEKVMDGIALRDIKWHPKTRKIAQVPSEGIEYAMLSAGYEQINQLVWCKDFMQDIIWSYFNNTPINIYNFRYDPTTCPAPSLRRLRLIVTNYKDHEFGEKLINNALPLIHSVEKKLKMSLTVVEKCRVCPPVYRKSGVWVVDASRRWIKAAPMLSLFTLLLRVGLVHTPGDTLDDTIKKFNEGKIKSYFDKRNRDKSMLANAKPGIDYILKFSDSKIFSSNFIRNYQGKENGYSFNVNTCHNNFGIVGFSNKSTASYFPEWHKRLKGI